MGNIYSNEQKQNSSITEEKYYDLRQQWKPWQGVVPDYIRYLCFIWQFIKYSFIFYLSVRQHQVLCEGRPIPEKLVGKVSPRAFKKARSYQKDLNYLKMFSCIYWIIFKVWFILYAGYTSIWFTSGPVLNWLGFWPDNWDWETGESLVFILLIVFSFRLSHLPLNLWKTFVIEENFGFNKMSIGDYLLDGTKKLLVGSTYSIVYGIFVLWIVRTMGRFFFVWLWIFSCFGLLITVAIYPHYVAPIFDSYAPLREGGLKARLRKLANFLGFPLEDILVLHQSWRSEHRKAYSYGLLKTKRIVLYDTLLKGYPESDRENEEEKRTKQGVAVAVAPDVPRELDVNESLRSVPSRIRIKVQKDLAAASSPSNNTHISQSDSQDSQTSGSRISIDTTLTEHEIEAIVAREMGHWVLGHSLKELMFPFVNMFIFFLIFSLIYENSSLYEAFAFPKGIDKPILLGLKLLYMDVIDVYSIFVGYLMKHFDRQRNFEADAFATKLGYGEDLIDAYIKIDKENLCYPYYDTWYWNFHFKEPSILRSIDAIEHEMERLSWKID